MRPMKFVKNEDSDDGKLIYQAENKALREKNKSRKKSRNREVISFFLILGAVRVLRSIFLVPGSNFIDQCHFILEIPEHQDRDSQSDVSTVRK